MTRTEQEQSDADRTSDAEGQEAAAHEDAAHEDAAHEDAAHEDAAHDDGASEPGAEAEDSDHASSTPDLRAREDGEDDWLPNWAPWAVLVGLVSVGVLGAAGVLSPKPDRVTAADVAATASADARDDAPTAEAEIEATHLLIMHKGSARKPDSVTRSKEEARARAAEALKRIRDGEDFNKIVAEYTDEASGKMPGRQPGQLGSFTRKMMVKPFADAAFALKVGQVSDIVETQFGYHVIKRTK